MCATLLAQPAPVLPPGEPLLPESALPAYEKDIDHAGLIRVWNRAALARGRETYQQVCQNCHGDLHLPGSMPTSLRFGQGVFQHGKDPYAMYQTLTRGWRMMAPQVQLVPREKYDVIHYIRETFLREHNRGQWTEVDSAYLASLPKGSGHGPAPVKREPWKEMNYGDLLIGTFEIMSPERRQVRPPAGSPPDYIAPGANLAYKAIALRLDRGEGGVAGGHAWAAFEHDTLRLAGAWTGDGFIDWRGINFDGLHAVRPRTIGDLTVETADVPGWANPETGDFVDRRIRGLDGRPYGPLPRSWGQYRGLYRHGARTVISYRVGDAAVLESYDPALQKPSAFVRTLNIGKSTRDLALRVANAGAVFAVVGAEGVKHATEAGFEVVRIPATATPLNLAVVYGVAAAAGKNTVEKPLDLRAFTRGGPAQWPAVLETPVIRGTQDGAFAVDSFALPQRVANPWKSWMRTSGLDFVPGANAAVVCTWDGEVWRVDGIRGDATAVKWTRIASGLFQPAGVKIVNGAVLVCCRDQIVRLQDLNGDGEADFYESFNSDHQVTDHFHEFAMGLQADTAGNLYYAKSARHARTALVPHNGALYCVTSYMPPSGKLPEINPKVLVKKSVSSGWEVDLEAGSDFMRLSFMKSVSFTTDSRGNKLPKSVSVLVTGTGTWRSQKDSGVVVFSRNDSSGKWTRSVLSPNRWNREKTNHSTDVRCIWDHVDRVTGVHYVFAGSASGRIFRGVYDPSQPGLIAWDAKPELDDLVGHFLCAAEANGVQYVGVAYGPTKEDVRQFKDRPVKDHGLFRRVDGPNARWEWVPIKEWEDPANPGRSLRTAQLRGLTAVPAPDGQGEVLVVAWDSRDAVIERIDPRNSFKATVELNVRDTFAKQWGRPVGIGTFAYNDMLPVTHPVTGEVAHLIGLWLVDPKGEGSEIGKSSWYLVRYADGTYRYQRIWDEKNLLTDSPYGLRGCRSIRPSPFAEEAGRVFYFCGFDQTGVRGSGATGPAAWIYKGTLKEKP
jgi:hypothetical protein